MPKKTKSAQDEDINETVTLNIKNEPIVNEFKKLIAQIRIQIDTAPSSKDYMTNHYRLRQLGAAVIIIKKFPKEIKSSDDLKGVKGIGPGTRSRIDEILKTGKLSEIKIDPKEEKYSKYIEELKQIHGIGPRSAYDFVVKYGIKSIDELKKAYNEGILDLPDTILTGLKYHDIVKQNIPREEITEIDKYLHDKAKVIDPQLSVTICGSYRRLKPTSNDIDVLITHPKIKTKLQLATQTQEENYLYRFIQLLTKEKFLVDNLTDRDLEIKYMGYCKYKKNPVRRIDMRYIAFESYPTAILYFTGSQNFNIKIRNLAISLGYLLNEYGLYKIINGKKIRIKITSEKDIFEKLGLEYLPPERRN